MKTTLKIIFFLVLIIAFGCQNESKQFVKHYKSHLQTRQIVPFSDAVQVDNLYFLTGQICKDHASGKLVEGDIEAKTKQTILNIEAVLNHHNLRLKDVVKCSAILADIKDFFKINGIYSSFFKENLPARTTFAANLMAGAKIEIEVIAARK